MTAASVVGFERSKLFPISKTRLHQKLIIYLDFLLKLATKHDFETNILVKLEFIRSFLNGELLRTYPENQTP